MNALHSTVIFKLILSLAFEFFRDASVTRNLVISLRMNSMICVARLGDFNGVYIPLRVIADIVTNSPLMQQRLFWR